MTATTRKPRRSKPQAKVIKLDIVCDSTYAERLYVDGRYVGSHLEILKPSKPELHRNQLTALDLWLAISRAEHHGQPVTLEIHDVRFERVTWPESLDDALKPVTA